ncbi:hypothetical protein K0M31_002262 [Melipona bicolor]|uniref:Uncharacterized protein n=1 Tax=Melipona bicolor TaxID=60889 RepID=A0AA40GH84_9HYME|nr:hypothetical protein K0M31_002262 [Melipona bicolor]
MERNSKCGLSKGTHGTILIHGIVIIKVVARQIDMKGEVRMGNAPIWFDKECYKGRREGEKERRREVRRLLKNFTRTRGEGGSQIG